MQGTLSNHHKPSLQPGRKRFRPHISLCMSLSAYLLDVIVISAVLEAFRDVRGAARRAAITRIGQARPRRGRATRVVVPIHKIDWEMP